MKTLPAIQKMLVSPADFSTRPVGRITRPFLNPLVNTRLAIDRSICILTRPVVITGFNRSLLVDWWSIGRLKENFVDVKILGIVYPPFY